MKSTFLSFSLAISFFTACCALNDDNLQPLPDWGSLLSDDDYRPPDPSLDNQKTLPNLIGNNNNKNGANLSPFFFDQTWITPSVVNANLGEAQAASTTAGGEDPDAHIFPLLTGGVKDCHVSENFKREGDQTKNVPPLLCPVLPGQKVTPPAAGAAGEEKNPVRIDDNTKKTQEPPLSSTENKFDYNEEVCPPDIYGATRQVPVCHSGNELLRQFDSSSGAWDLWDIRPFSVAYGCWSPWVKYCCAGVKRDDESTALHGIKSFIGIDCCTILDSRPNIQPL